MGFEGPCWFFFKICTREVLQVLEYNFLKITRGPWNFVKSTNKERKAVTFFWE